MRSAVGASALLVALLASGCFGASGALADTRRTVGVSDPLWFDTGVPRDETLDEGTYWLVYVSGAEEHDVKSGAGNDRHVECPPPPRPLYALDRYNRTLAYDPGMANLREHDRITIVLIIDFEGVGFGSKSVATSCRTEYRIEAFQHQAEAAVHLQNFGKTTIMVYPRGGALGVIGPDAKNMTFVLPLGKGLGYEYTKIGTTESSEYWVFGRWHVQNLGAWPKSGLTPAA